MPNRINEWRVRRGLSQAQIARAVGTSRQQILKLERGERRLTAEWMTKLARALECTEADLFASSLRPDLSGFLTMSSPTSPKVGEETRMPIRRVARTGEDGFYILEASDTASTPLPPGLHGVPGAYGLYVHDDMLAPRYRPGWLLHINPIKPASDGRAVVIYMRDGRLLLGILRSRSATGLSIIVQICPELVVAIAHGDFEKVHLVVGSDEEG